MAKEVGCVGLVGEGIFEHHYGKGFRLDSKMMANKLLGVGYGCLQVGGCGLKWEELGWIGRF